MKKLKLYIPTCDSYLWLMKPFMFLFNKFWGESMQVVYLGYNRPEFDLPDNCTFISLGNDDSVEYWASDLKKYFDSIDDTHLLLTTDDFCLVNYTNLEMYNKVLRLINTNSNIGRVDLKRDLITRPFEYYDTFEGTDFVSASPSASHNISCTWSIWKKDYLVKFLKPGRTPWMFEDLGTPESNNYSEDIIAPIESLLDPTLAPGASIVHNTNVVWRKWYKQYNRLNFHDSTYASDKALDIEVIKEMKSLGMIPSDSDCGMIIQGRWKSII